ncbi:hypothetical protein B0H17DRAFT_1129536 [Mycena rosella]|uniref:Uncharacterized protein n=1 Tax=Mycena rosella TaxID=1033263 RepID=A0AAD7GNA6_MYCRO|nr:hypothetical protein B0H17DRAFT_1129536 [Mycena rosella]
MSVPTLLVVVAGDEDEKVWIILESQPRILTWISRSNRTMRRFNALRAPEVIPDLIKSKNTTSEHAEPPLISNSCKPETQAACCLGVGMSAARTSSSKMCGSATQITKLWMSPRHFRHFVTLLKCFVTWHVLGKFSDGYQLCAERGQLGLG